MPEANLDAEPWLTPDFAREADGERLQREIVLVAGAEFPKYHGPAADGCFYLVGGRLGLEVDRRGRSHWRQKCEALASYRTARANYKVTLFDFSTATREELRAGKFEVVERFAAVRANDYRRQVVTGIALSLEPLARKVCVKERPWVRYYPRISEIDERAAVSHATYLEKLGLSSWRDAGLSIRHVYEYLTQIGSGIIPTASSSCTCLGTPLQPVPRGMGLSS